jgi:hypothetical protein
MVKGDHCSVSIPVSATREGIHLPSHVIGSIQLLTEDAKYAHTIHTVCMLIRNPVLSR